MALRNSERRVLLPGKEDDNTAAIAAHQRLRRTAIARLWINRLNQTARRRLTPIRRMHMVDATAIRDAFHRADVILLDLEIPANGASGVRLRQMRLGRQPSNRWRLHPPSDMSHES